MSHYNTPSSWTWCFIIIRVRSYILKQILRWWHIVLLKDIWRHTRPCASSQWHKCLIVQWRHCLAFPLENYFYSYTSDLLPACDKTTISTSSFWFLANYFKGTTLIYDAGLTNSFLWCQNLSLHLTIWFLSFLLLTWYMILTDFHILNYSCVPRMKYTWSWCVNFFW